ncbi:MAG: hypothetical protein ABIF10_03495 [Candidatus Woesearchaeota archaeon]
MRGPAIALLLSLFVIGIGFEPLGKIRFDEFAERGSQLVVYVNAINEANYNLENVRFTAFIPDLGLSYSTRQFVLDDDSKQSKVLLIDIPYDAPVGLYLMQISGYNHDSFRTREYRHVLII